MCQNLLAYSMKRDSIINQNFTFEPKTKESMTKLRSWLNWSKHGSDAKCMVNWSQCRKHAKMVWDSVSPPRPFPSPSLCKVGPLNTAKELGGTVSSLARSEAEPQPISNSVDSHLKIWLLEFWCLKFPWFLWQVHHSSSLTSALQVPSSNRLQLVIYRVRQNKVAPLSFLLFFSNYSNF